MAALVAGFYFGFDATARELVVPEASDLEGYVRLDADTVLNPFSGEFYREALVVSRYTREMFCLMEGRHVHPSTLYPGGVGTHGDPLGNADLRSV